MDNPKGKGGGGGGGGRRQVTHSDRSREECHTADL